MLTELDTYFNVDKWRRGLRFMANHVRIARVSITIEHALIEFDYQTRSWSNLASMSLRNELRSPDEDPELSATEYNWLDWYVYLTPP